MNIDHNLIQRIKKSAKQAGQELIDGRMLTYGRFQEILVEVNGIEAVISLRPTEVSIRNGHNGYEVEILIEHYHNRKVVCSFDIKVPPGKHDCDFYVSSVYVRLATES